MLILNYTSPISVIPFAESAWVITQTNLYDVSQTGNITLLGYATAQDVGVSQSIGQKSYMITPELYKKYFTGSIDYMANGYAVAKAIQDVVIKPEGAEVLDDKGNVITPAVSAVMASMFADAVEV